MVFCRPARPQAVQHFVFTFYLLTIRERAATGNSKAMVAARVYEIGAKEHLLIPVSQLSPIWKSARPR
jgi:hypothetical protein